MAVRVARGRRRGRVVALVLAGLLLAGLRAPPASAQAPAAELAKVFQAGTDAYRLGDYPAARALLERAIALDDSLPGPHRFLAAVDAAEGKWQDCVGAARRAIAANPASSEIVATRKLHDDCRSALGRPGYGGDYAGGGAIAVTANVSGAVVTLAGLRAGATPLAPRPFGLGEVELEVTKPGWVPARVTATVLPGVVTDVEVVLVEAVAPLLITDPGLRLPTYGRLVLTVDPRATVRIDGVVAVADADGSYRLERGEHTVTVERAGWVSAVRAVRIASTQRLALRIELTDLATVARRRRLGTIALGAAVGFGVAGAVTGLLSMRSADQARDWAALERLRPTAIPIEATAGQVPVHTRADIEARSDRARTLAIASGVGYALSAAAVGVGVYLLTRDPDPAPLEVAPILGDGWGVAVRGALP